MSKILPQILKYCQRSQISRKVSVCAHSNVILKLFHKPKMHGAGIEAVWE